MWGAFTVGARAHAIATGSMISPALTAKSASLEDRRGSVPALLKHYAVTIMMGGVKYEAPLWFNRLSWPLHV